MRARSNFLKGKNCKKVALALAVLGITVAAVLLASGQRTREAANSSSDPSSTTAGPARSLTETGRAGFISVFVYNAAGQVSSYMIGSGTDEFNAFAQAIENAQPVGTAADETFSDLLVISFGHNDTVDLSYSPEKNTLIHEEQAYRPATDLAPLISRVEQKFDF